MMMMMVRMIVVFFSFVGGRWTNIHLMVNWWFRLVVRDSVPLYVTVPFIFGDPIGIQTTKKKNCQLTIRWEMLVGQRSLKKNTLAVGHWHHKWLSLEGISLIRKRCRHVQGMIVLNSSFVSSLFVADVAAGIPSDWQFATNRWCIWMDPWDKTLNMTQTRWL